MGLGTIEFSITIITHGAFVVVAYQNATNFVMPGPGQESIYSSGSY